MKPDEIALLGALLARRGAGMLMTPVKAGEFLEMPLKRVKYIIRKWEERGWWEKDSFTVKGYQETLLGLRNLDGN